MKVPEAGFSALEWTKYLIEHETITPSKNEKKLLEEIKPDLEKAGFTVTLDEYDKKLNGRCSLSAHLHPEIDSNALCMGGHIDTVPLGTKKWDYDPFSGKIADGKIYGRGSCDMKSGVGALLAASIKLSSQIRDRDFIIHLYGGEELNAEGSAHMMEEPDFYKNMSAVIICEPTGGQPLLGHRGSLWLKLKTTGKTAHACMPHLGDNALLKLLSGITSLHDFSFDMEHPVLGKSTFAISSLHSGLNVNSIPDSAYLTIDIRTIPEQTTQYVIQRIRELVSNDIEIELLQILPSLWTSPENEFVKQVFSTYKKITKKEPDIAAVNFATDGASIRRVLKNVPIVILGPGETSQAHQLNEFCRISDIEQVQNMYEQIIKDFYSL